MKIITPILIGFIAFSAQAQNLENDYLSKCQRLDSTLETLYDVISGEKGEARDWDLLNYLFKSDANLIPSEKNKDGVYELRYLTPQDYIDQSGSWLI
jgi:hypothetical protein